MRGMHKDQVYDLGLVPIVKTARAAGGGPRPPTRRAQSCAYRRHRRAARSVHPCGRARSLRSSSAANAHLCSSSADARARRTRTRGYRWYNDYAVPDQPRSPDTSTAHGKSFGSTTAPNTPPTTTAPRRSAPSRHRPGLGSTLRQSPRRRSRQLADQTILVPQPRPTRRCRPQPLQLGLPRDLAQSPRLGRAPYGTPSIMTCPDPPSPSTSTTTPTGDLRSDRENAPPTSPPRHRAA